MFVRLSFPSMTAAVSIGLVVALAGCAVAPAGTEEVEGASATRSPDLVTVGPTALWTETMYGSAGNCSATEVSVPSQLGGYGCTLGATYLEGSNESFTAWACPAAVKVAGIVPASGFGLGPRGSEESASIVLYQADGESCFGYPDSGYVLVVDVVARGGSIRGGCSGECAH